MVKLLDANLIVRYLTQDNLRQAKAFEHLLKTAKEKLILTDVTMAEIVWVLSSYYELPKKEIIEKIEGILGLEIFEINRDIIGQALTYYRQYNLDWIDAYLAAYGKRNKIKTILSYDRDLDKISEVKRKEP